MLELVEAVPGLVDGGRAVQMVISGIGPDVEAVQRRITELGLVDVVTLTGAAGYDMAPSVYRRGDVFVSPTWSEGFSNTILEAMATGLPIVSTRAVGVVDCLCHEDNALLVEPHDVDALTAAMARLLDDAPLRTRLATHGLDEVRARYSWEAVSTQIVGVYRALLGTSPNRSWPPLAALGAPIDRDCRFRTEPHLL